VQVVYEMVGMFATIFYELNMFLSSSPNLDMFISIFPADVSGSSGRGQSLLFFGDPG
jgi:hypothetical protein